MNPRVKVGASVPQGLYGPRMLQALKLGDFMLAKIPDDFDQALAVARYCRRHRITFAFSEVLHRGSRDLWGHRPLTASSFFTRDQMDRILSAGGRYYLGRMTLGEVGGMLYWPKEYIIRRACGNYLAFPQAKTMDRACDLYVRFMKETIAFERELSGGRLLDVDSSMTFKYHLQAGIDVPVIEAMPGDCDLLYAALRGAARAYGCREWGAHIAMHCYGGLDVCDPLWLQRWRTSLFHSFLSGTTFIYPESGHFSKSRHSFDSPEVRQVRRSLRELYRFANIHTRPAGFPEVRIAFAHGHRDGYPGLWNKYVWGQYFGGRKWLHGPPEWGWNHLAGIYRAEEWWNPNVRGVRDYSGHPPGGLCDVAPVEAPLPVLQRYGCLFFLGWNTMTPALYRKLKAYVRAGGHLVMAVPHLSVETDRGRDLRLIHGGDFRDLFGVRVHGKGQRDVLGVRYVAPSTLSGYEITTWSCDPKFIGDITPARVEVAGGRVLAGVQKGNQFSPEEVAAQPLLVEHSVGKGKAFLITTWSWPGEPGMQEFMREILRMVTMGEHGRLRVTGSDRVRHAVYRARGLRTIYFLNTDPDTPHTVTLHLDGRCAVPLTVPPADLRLVLERNGLGLVPADKHVDIARWSCLGLAHEIAAFSLRSQNVLVFNAARDAQSVRLNGRTETCSPGRSARLRLERRTNPRTARFFRQDFLAEPDVQWQGGPLPY